MVGINQTVWCHVICSESPTGTTTLPCILAYQFPYARTMCIVQLICYPASHRWLLPVDMLKADPVFDLRLLESVILLDRVFGWCSFTSFGAATWNSYALVFAALQL